MERPIREDMGKGYDVYLRPLSSAQGPPSSPPSGKAGTAMGHGD